MINILQKLAVVQANNAYFFTTFFGEYIFKIVTLVSFQPVSRYVPT
jgi:hypothetical protein